jgi:hypothetical protein
VGGTIRGRIECFNNAGIVSSSEGRNAFKNIYEHYNNHPLATLVALNYGGGSGTDYHDGGNPWGEGNAFFVFKMAASSLRTWSYYVLFQLAGNSAFGSAPGNPGLCNGTTQSTSFMDIGCAVAIGVGGDEDPWNGTSVGDGTDTKGTPVWVAPSGGSAVYVLPRSNNPTGTHATNKENTMEIFDTSIYLRAAVESNRYHIVGDDDHLLILMDEDDNNTYSAFLIDVFSPNPDLTLTHPMVMLRDNSLPYNPASNFGSQAGSDAARDGGVIVAGADVAKDPVVGVMGDSPDVLAAANEPNTFKSSNVFDVLSWQLRGGGTGGEPVGFLGYTNFMREAHDMNTHDENSTRRLVAFGDAVLASRKLVVDWDGTTVPKSGVTKEGVTFTNP